MKETWIKNIAPTPLDVPCFVELGGRLIVPAVVRLNPGESAWLRTTK